MKERTMMFGAQQSLLGILTEPKDTESAQSARAGTPRPAVILLNAGLIHRVGPNRLYVQLARRLASAGHAVLRFDYSGIGDSPPRADRIALDQRAIAEVKEAMDHLAATRGQSRFVLIGLCSGADDAIRTSLVDERVVGLGLLEPCAYFADGWYRYSYGKRLKNLRSWIDLATGRSDLWRLVGRKLKSKLSRQAPAAIATKSHSDDWDVLSLDAFRDALRAITAAHKRTLLLYCAESSAWFNFHRHVRPKLLSPLPQDLVEIAVEAAADHTFTGLQDQAAVLARVERWMGGFVGSR